jgi:hypothetical protein
MSVLIEQHNLKDWRSQKQSLFLSVTFNGPKGIDLDDTGKVWKLWIRLRELTYCDIYGVFIDN